jgi:hypothetical protein
MIGALCSSIGDSVLIEELFDRAAQEVYPARASKIGDSSLMDTSACEREVDSDQGSPMSS